MKIKRFFAKDIRTALDEIKISLGADAIIMSNKNVEGGVEIVAAIDEDNNAVIEKSSAKRAYQPAETLTPPPQFDNQPSAVTPAAFNEPGLNNHWDTSSRIDKEFNDDQVSLSGFQQRLIKQQAQHAAHEFQNNSFDIAPASAPASAPIGSEHIASSFNNDLSSNQWQESARLASNDHNSYSAGVDTTTSSTVPDDKAIDELRNEMSAMRQLLQHQVNSLMSQEAKRRDPIRHCIINQLIAMGFDENVAQQLVVHIPPNVDIHQAKEMLASTMLKRVTSTNNDVLENGGIVALLGPTGVGKTTTVAKLAARYAMRFGHENVAMITTDSYRIGAYEQLNTYGKIMGCNVQVVKDAQQLADAIFQYRDKRLVLIDTAGMGQRDIRLNEQLTTLMSSSHVAIRSYLVLPATAQRKVLEEAILQFRKIPLAGCIVTKMDEAIGASEILSVAIGNALPIGYLTNGQRVPEDIGVADIKKLINNVVDSLGKALSNESISDVAGFNR